MQITRSFIPSAKDTPLYLGERIGNMRRAELRRVARDLDLSLADLPKSELVSRISDRLHDLRRDAPDWRLGLEEVGATGNADTDRSGGGEADPVDLAEVGVSRPADHGRGKGFWR